MRIQHLLDRVLDLKAMKKSTLFIALCLIGIIIPVLAFRIFHIQLPPGVKDTLQKNSITRVTLNIPTPTPTPIPVGIPQTIRIQKIGVDAPIEEVGLDEERRMDVPKVITNTGWYMNGTRPGDRGSAVIDGHYNTPTGAPSVFYDLKNLVIGDIIEVKDETGTTRKFEVYDIQTYDLATIPMDQIFEKTDEIRLNLITCEGTWNTRDKDYSQRVVVYSQLIK